MMMARTITAPTSHHRPCVLLPTNLGIRASRSTALRLPDNGSHYYISMGARRLVQKRLRGEERKGTNLKHFR